jgi:putative transposase
LLPWEGPGERSVRHRARQDQSRRIEDAAGAGGPRRHTLRGIERGEIGAVEAIDALLTEELTTRENRRVRMAVQMAEMLRSTAGWIVHDKRVERIWRREGLKVPAKQSKQGRIWLADGSCIRLRAERPTT